MLILTTSRIDLLPLKVKKPLQITSGSGPSKSDLKKKNDQSDQERAECPKHFNKDKKTYVVDEEKDKKKPREYYQEDENEKIDYYDPDAFIEDKDIIKDDQTVNMTVFSTTLTFCCCFCRETFKSNNKLHKHF